MARRLQVVIALQAAAMQAAHQPVNLEAAFCIQEALQGSAALFIPQG